MQMFIWAFGAMIVLMLIIAFLPIGFTLRGKISVVLAGFVMALGGLAAVSSFPLWQTVLIVFLLVLVVAYIMDSRFAAVMYNQELDSFDDDREEIPDAKCLFKQTEKTTEFDLIDLDELESAEPSFEKLEVTEHHSIELQPQMKIVQSDEMIEDDISFLEEQSIISIDETNNDSISETGYLSDIENLLLEDSEEDTVTEDEGWLEKLSENNSDNAEDNTMPSESEENDLEELFFAMEEAAAGQEADQKENDLKKTVQLQK